MAASFSKQQCELHTLFLNGFPQYTYKNAFNRQERNHEHSPPFSQRLTVNEQEWLRRVQRENRLDVRRAEEKGDCSDKSS